MTCILFTKEKMWEYTQETQATPILLLMASSVSLNVSELSVMNPEM